MKERQLSNVSRQCRSGPSEGDVTHSIGTVLPGDAGYERICLHRLMSGRSWASILRGTEAQPARHVQIENGKSRPSGWLPRLKTLLILLATVFLFDRDSHEQSPRALLRYSQICIPSRHADSHCSRLWDAGTCRSLCGRTAAVDTIHLLPKPSHFTPKAKHVIFLFMNGGPSHVDTFDPKPQLNVQAGKPGPGGNFHAVTVLLQADGKEWH